MENSQHNAKPMRMPTADELDRKLADELYRHPAQFTDVQPLV